ncbi:MAG: Acetolactate synthase isozyme 3 large subunit [Alphaproteobacteria bacterium MarineAlpha11_Bin1]|nr:MAG: Acetolactate synthase isozyme 3 large subunit [Alphaproteobacteria bacterium MarineAlpha11_Bin1]|tara:strand:- start:6957 stop:8708 length:1752 start_codon:yes stop_codon:yes gene_type:complete
MPAKTINVDSAAEAYLTLLKDRGVDYLFGNAGTDFPSIIEALSKSLTGEGSAPTPMTVPHENLGVSMAHGYYIATGRLAAVMVHVNVGTANAICGIMNAARENVPILMTSGRTPLTEEGFDGSRSLFIHWGQEMFDQASTLREMVKWDYELRNAKQIETIVDRAINIAMTEPRGPVYLSLPREVLAEKPGEFTYQSPSRRVAAQGAAPDPNALDEAAEILSVAENPLIITASMGQNRAAVPALESLAERFALPVITYRPRYVNIASDHPMHLGYEPGAHLPTVDAVLVLDCDVPWIPSLHHLNPDAKVVHLGADPLYENYPVRGFPCDLGIRANAVNALPQLEEAMAQREKSAKDRIQQRRKRIKEIKAEQVANNQVSVERIASGGAAMDNAWVAHCIGQLKEEDDILVSESQLALPNLGLKKPGTFFGTGPAGGLGWGIGAGIGVKLGQKDKRIWNVVGDGSYMFGNPTPAHFVSAAYDLPILTVIINNKMWGSVRKATLGLYPEGAASTANQAPLTYLEPAPDYHKIVEASGGYGEEVNDPNDLPAALERGVKAVDNEGRTAVINVHTTYDDAAAKADAVR